MERKTKVMVIDDNADLLEELKDALEASGKTVSIFTKGEQALKKAGKIRPDIIFVDLKLDNEDGFYVASQFKGLEHTENTPVITMSGYYTDEITDKLVKVLGINEHVVKPFSPERIEKIIEKETAG